MTEAGPSRRPRRAAALLGLLLALGALAHQAWGYRRLLAGDGFAANDLLAWRPLARRAARSADAPLGRVAGLSAMTSHAHLDGLSASDAALLRDAVNDPSPLVRLAARDALLRFASKLPLAKALDLVDDALRDDAPLGPDDLDAARQGGATWTALGELHASRRPGEAYSSGLHVAALLVELDDPPTLALDDALLRDEARRRALEASIPARFAARPDGWATVLDEARRLLAAWRPWLATRADDGRGAPLARLRAALKGHPTHDPARYIAALESARRAQ